jgi:hypothetical protein
VNVEEVKWDEGGYVRAGYCIFFNGKGNENRQLGSVKTVEFVSDRISYIVLRGRWCNIIVLNVHAPSEKESDDSNDKVYKELEQVFDNFPF